MLKHHTELRVRYADTDQMKFVYNGKFFEYFEVGRTEMMRDVGLPYDMIEKNGYHMPVIETKIHFIQPAFYDELLLIETWVEKLPAVKVHIDHIIKAKERNVVICEGYVELAFLNSKTNRPARAPEFFIDAVKKYYE
ncbi:MAG: acyl-CoA thioesterase [Ignavibacteriota bacterium]|jgi:acyl-CoA thioester hydrolase|nr:acyl-CoA thioesterase [Ignavibacteriota bacterium]MBW7841240.1 acyl-CoA thioesterase [Ignavibacterium sp.]MCO6448696.1 acyl-CoA thioesterase [Ignavibacterium album]MCZ2269427.1 acyl-CoA thioesterase [Ignavibacteriales bacterium]MDX9711018.1 thioesterase family protein [Ignavibacteriaceae bacterium]